jgi:hypothetical protein
VDIQGVVIQYACNLLGADFNSNIIVIQYSHICTRLIR